MEIGLAVQGSPISVHVMECVFYWRGILIDLISNRASYKACYPFDSNKLLGVLYGNVGPEAHAAGIETRMLLMVENTEYQKPPFKIEESTVYKKLRDMDPYTGNDIRKSYGILATRHLFVLFEVRNRVITDYILGCAEEPLDLQDESSRNMLGSTIADIVRRTEKSTFKYAPTRQYPYAEDAIMHFTPINALQVRVSDRTSINGSTTPLTIASLPHSSLTVASTTSQPQHLLSPLLDIGYPQHFPSISDSSQLSHSGAVVSFPGPSAGFSSPDPHMIVSPHASRILQRLPPGSHPDDQQHSQSGTPRLHPQANTVVSSPAPRVPIASPSPRTTSSRVDTPQSSRR